MVGGVEHGGGGRVERRLARSGQRLRLRAGMDHAGLEAEVAVAPVVFLAHQSRTRRRLAEMMPELKTHQESPACSRHNSIFGQRSMTTVRPEARARAAAEWFTPPSRIPPPLIPFPPAMPRPPNRRPL